MPVVFSAPHRALFFAGVSSALLLMVWWLFSLMGTGSAGGMGWFIHGYWMLLGVLPFFMAGFIFTAGPKWLAVAAPPRSAWLSMGGLMVSGVLLSMVGAGQVPLLWPLGVTLLALGTGVLMVVWSGRIAASKQADRRHAWAVLLAFALGTLAHGAAVMWVWTGEVDWWWRMRELALWGFLLPVFLTISHRMLPFFSGAALPIYSVWRPDWLLAAFWAGSLGHGGLALLGVPTVWVDLPFAALLGFVSVRWGLRASQKVKLLAMLHLAFAWAAVAFALYSLNAGLLALGMPLDAATAEISRSQVWQWVVSPKGVLDDGRKVTVDMVRGMIAEELAKVNATVTAQGENTATYDQAAVIFDKMSLTEEYPEFLTLPLYEAMA